MFQFEGYTLDIACGALRTATVTCVQSPLRSCANAGDADRIITKQELIKAVWPNVIVTDRMLTHSVAEVRQAIGDSEQIIIKQIPHRGYRFTAPVSRVAESTAPAAPSPLVRQSRGVGATDCCPAVPHLPTSTPDPSPRAVQELGRVGDRPSVAVLPFANLNGDPQQDYFSNGITEDIITELSRFSELMVIARNSGFQYKDKEVDTRLPIRAAYPTPADDSPRPAQDLRSWCKPCTRSLS